MCSQQAPNLAALQQNFIVLLRTYSNLFNHDGETKEADLFEFESLMDEADRFAASATAAYRVVKEIDEAKCREIFAKIPVFDGQ